MHHSKPPENRQKNQKNDPDGTTPLLANDSGDHGSIEPVLTHHCENTGEGLPPTVFADAGYVSAPALERAENQGYELCGPMAPATSYNGRWSSEEFEVDLPNRSACCPAGKLSAQCMRIKESEEKSPD